MSWEVSVADEADELLARHGLASPQHLLEHPSATLIERDQAAFSLRHGSRAGLLRRLRGLPAPGRGLYDQLQTLGAQGLSCVRPLLFAEQRMAGLPGRWVLLSEAPPAARPLPSFLRDAFRGCLPGWRERRRLLRDVASMLRQVAESGWANPGASARSILVGGWPGAYRPIFAGCPLAHPTDGPAPVERALLLELARLFGDCCSRAELLRFLRACDLQGSSRLVRRAMRER